MPAPGDLLGKVDLAAEHKVALDGEFYTTNTSEEKLMDLASFIIASVACITVICYLAATAVKQPPLANKRSIFSDQSPRDEHERLREVRVRPEGNGAAKKPQHLLRLFLVHHRGLEPRTH